MPPLLQPPLPSAATPRLRWHARDPGAVDAWRLADVAAPPGFAAALAVAGAPDEALRLVECP